MMKGNQIANLIYADYLMDIQEEEQNKIDDKKLEFLLENDLASKICLEDQLLEHFNHYHIACFFISKYSKELKKKIKNNKIHFFEYANRCEEVRKYMKYFLDSGHYYAQIDEENFIILMSDVTRYTDNSGIVTFTMYFIGPKHEKYFNKCNKIWSDVYNKQKETDNECIVVKMKDGNNHNFKAGVPFKNFDQYIFKDKGKLIKYIDHWVENIPKYYLKYGITPKLSILLYGKPGTGKSTMYQAIALYLKIKRIVSIQDASAFYSIGNRSSNFVVIDDIDLICGSRDKEESWKLKEALNFLDAPPTGYIEAKDGKRYPISIVVATTNHYDKLDPALKRYGRFDLQIELKDFDREDAEEMCALYDLKLEDVIDGKIKDDFKIQPAKLQALCLQNIDDTMKGRN